MDRKRRKVLGWAWRDPVEETAITLVWLIPLLAIITCDPPDIRVAFAAIVTVVLLEALFARWTRRKVSWRRLMLAAFIGTLVGGALGYALLALLAPYCALPLWAVVGITALVSAASELLLVLIKGRGNRPGPR